MARLRANAIGEGRRAAGELQFIGQDYNFDRTARGMRNEGERERTLCLRY